MLKGNKKETPEEKIKEQEEIITELEAKTKEMKEENKHLHQQLSSIRATFKMTGIAALVLFLLVVVESIILFS
jgi:molecular chaperone GrpE (heat shock protein)